MKKITIIISVLAMSIANIMAQPTGSESENYYNLGYSYYNGVDGADPDYYNAVQWLLKAAEFNHTKAQELLGECYYLGNGVEQNISMALNYFHLAANQGNASAQCSLGSIYGELGYKELKEKWLKESAEMVMPMDNIF
jgi:TPR repeat protein